MGTLTSRPAGGCAEPQAGGEPDELLVLLVRTVKALVDRLRASSPYGQGERADLTVVHAVAARYLVRQRDVTTVDLARYLRMTKQSASEVVALLEQHGIVRRAPHPRDGRARLLLITEEGRARIEDGSRRWQEVEDEWAGVAGQEQLEVVRQALAAYLAATDPAAAPPAR